MRRALLIFAHETHVDLARRSLPNAAGPLLNLLNFNAQLSFPVDVHLFTSGKRASLCAAHIHRQVGRSFAARFENAIERVAQFGYDEVVAIGRDCPDLRAEDIENAFAELASKKLVLGPDHSGGCYLIALRSADRALLQGIRWNQNSDCAQLRDRCGIAHVLLLSVKHDVDSWADVRLFARGGDRLARLAAFLVRVICDPSSALIHLFDIAAQQVRVRQQMPPPAFAI
jgi:glycosyltransferase A (GT-A) superfamily protein (DUF2064 family)